jgi:hypothetical protein
MSPQRNKQPAKASYAFLDPAGTFTEIALSQIKQAKGAAGEN